MNGRNFLAFLDASSCTCDAESACSLQVKKEGACRWCFGAKSDRGDFFPFFLITLGKFATTTPSRHDALFSLASILTLWRLSDDSNSSTTIPEYEFWSFALTPSFVFPWVHTDIDCAVPSSKCCVRSSSASPREWHCMRKVRPRIVNLNGGRLLLERSASTPRVLNWMDGEEALQPRPN